MRKYLDFFCPVKSLERLSFLLNYACFSI